MAIARLSPYNCTATMLQLSLSTLCPSTPHRTHSVSNTQGSTSRRLSHWTITESNTNIVFQICFTFLLPFRQKPNFTVKFA